VQDAKKKRGLFVINTPARARLDAVEVPLSLISSRADRFRARGLAGAITRAPVFELPDRGVVQN